MIVIGVPFLAIEMWPLSGESQQLLETAYGTIWGRDHSSAVYGHSLYNRVGVRRAACRQEQAGLLPAALPTEPGRGAFEQSLL